MDDYLFIVLAKLKADRLKLERERAVAQPEIPGLDVAKSASPRARRSAVEIPADLMSIVPTHGLRGWS